MTEILHGDFSFNVQEMADSMYDYMSDIVRQLNEQRSLKAKKLLLNRKRAEIGTMNSEDELFAVKFFQLDVIRYLNTKLDLNIPSANNDVNLGVGSYTKRISGGVENRRRTARI